MAFEDRTNRAQYPVQGSTPVIFTIPPGGKVLRGNIIITGSVVISGGTTNGAIIGEGGPINIVNWIKITANRGANSRYPGGRIVDCDPRSLLRYAITEKGKFIGEQSGSTLGNGAAGTYPIYLSIPVYFADGTLRNEIQTALNADLLDSQGRPVYTSIQVEVDFVNSLASIFAGSDRVLNTSGLTCQWDDDRLSIATDTVPLVQETHIQQIGAANRRMQDFGLPQDGSFLSWLVMAEQGAVNLLADTIVNRITLQSPTLNLDEYYQDIRQRMYDDNWYDAAQAAAGQFFIDFTHGILQNANPAPGFNVKYDVNNPSGANLDQLRVYTRRMFSLLS